MAVDKVLLPLASLVFSMSLFTAAFCSGKALAAEKGLREQPQVMLWAWDRREDLSFINPRETGVAFLAQMRATPTTVRSSLAQSASVPRG